MKKILKITLLLIIACFIAACGASKEEKLLDLAAKIEYNKPLIIESVRKHQVDSTMVDLGIKRDEEIQYTEQCLAELSQNPVIKKKVCEPGDDFRNVSYFQ